jgi:G3E family GTPase
LGTLELDEAIGQFAYPGSPIDYIIIEASGLAEPADLAMTLREASGRHTRLDAIVAVLDSAHLEENASAHTTALQQIEYSDFVLINKTDLVPTGKVDQIKTLIRGINERARILTSIRGQVDVRLLLDQSAHDDAKAIEHDHGKHLHEDYQTVSFATKRPLDPAAFQKFVNEEIPNSVYRAKGFVNLGNKGHRRKYIFQLVGKRADLTWTDWNDEAPRTELVFIGRDFDTSALLKLAQATVDSQPDSADPEKQVVLPKHQI